MINNVDVQNVDSAFLSDEWEQLGLDGRQHVMNKRNQICGNSGYYQNTNAILSGTNNQNGGTNGNGNEA
jgi:hypothetical protein